MIDPAYQCTNHAIDIFVLQHPKDSPGKRVISHLIQIGRQMCRRMRIMANVKHNSRTPGKHLESPRQFNTGQALADGLNRNRQAIAH
jgi:hypothetical protein